jgi:hypothetical protein
LFDLTPQRPLSFDQAYDKLGEGAYKRPPHRVSLSNINLWPANNVLNIILEQTIWILFYGSRMDDCQLLSFAISRYLHYFNYPKEILWNKPARHIIYWKKSIILCMSLLLICSNTEAQESPAWEKKDLFLVIMNDFFNKPFKMPDTADWFK